MFRAIVRQSGPIVNVLWVSYMGSSLCYNRHAMEVKNVKTVATNRKALHDYSIEERAEAGMVLTGTEIKSVRAGRVTLGQAFARVENGELWLFNAHIAQYEAGNRYNHDPARTRKLLMNRDEINRLAGRVNEQRFTLVPLRVYLKKGLAKVEIGLGKGKKMYDKRQTIAKRDADRDIDRAMKTRRQKA